MDVQQEQDGVEQNIGNMITMITKSSYAELVLVAQVLIIDLVITGASDGTQRRVSYIIMIRQLQLIYIAPNVTRDTALCYQTHMGVHIQRVCVQCKYVVDNKRLVCPKFSYSSNMVAYNAFTYKLIVQICEDRLNPTVAIGELHKCVRIGWYVCQSFLFNDIWPVF